MMGTKKNKKEGKFAQLAKWEAGWLVGGICNRSSKRKHKKKKKKELHK